MIDGWTEEIGTNPPLGMSAQQLPRRSAGDVARFGRTQPGAGDRVAGLGRGVIAVRRLCRRPPLADQSVVVTMTDAEELTAVIRLQRTLGDFFTAAVSVDAARCRPRAEADGGAECQPCRQCTTDREALRRLAADQLDLSTAWVTDRIAAGTSSGRPCWVSVAGDAVAGVSVVAGPNEVEPPGSARRVIKYSRRLGVSLGCAPSRGRDRVFGHHDRYFFDQGPNGPAHLLCAYRSSRRRCRGELFGNHQKLSTAALDAASRRRASRRARGDAGFSASN